MDCDEYLGCAASPFRTADGSAADWGPAGPRDSNLVQWPRRIAGPLGRKWRGSWPVNRQAGQGFSLGVNVRAERRHGVHRGRRAVVTT